MLLRQRIARVVAFVVVFGAATGLAQTPTASGLVGVWQVMGGAGQQSAGLYVFTRTHYSMMVAATNRPDIADINGASAPDELRALFVPMIANSGTYEIAGDLMTIHPIAAKFPVVMKAGATEVYAVRVDGNTLSLAQRRNARGVDVQNAASVRLVRVE